MNECLTLTGDKCNLIKSEGTSWDHLVHLVQTLCAGTVSYSKLLGAISSWVLDISKGIWFSHLSTVLDSNI